MSYSTNGGIECLLNQKTFYESKNKYWKVCGLEILLDEQCSKIGLMLKRCRILKSKNLISNT